MTLVTDTRQDPARDALRRRTVVWVVGLATVGLIFDGYDLVVYGIAAHRLGRGRWPKTFIAPLLFRMQPWWTRCIPR